jgi:hypothetical protein
MLDAEDRDCIRAVVNAERDDHRSSVVGDAQAVSDVVALGRAVREGRKTLALRDDGVGVPRRDLR